MEDERPSINLRGLSPVTAEMIGEISNLSVALAQARQQLQRATDEIAALRARLTAPDPAAGG